MEKYISALLKSENAEEIKREYRILLSMGLSDAEAEDALVAYFFSDATEVEEGMQWISFALIQWTLGRLSSRVFSMAKRWIEDPKLGLSSEMMCAVNERLNTPMPVCKKVARMRTIKCPWKKGALLAYKISTCTDEQKSRFWGKYVLLRVIEIKRWPISSIMPDLLYDESMYVALYDWVGEEIPNADIVSDLEFTHISVQQPLIPQFSNNTLSSFYLSATTNARHNIMLDTTYKHYVYALSWGNKKNAAEFLTLISDGTQDSYFFDQDKHKVCIPPLIGPAGFDITLIKRLEQLFPKS